MRTHCTEQLFRELELPESLRADGKLNPVGRELVHDRSVRSALIPHPFHHSDYPDRSLSFYVRGRHFGAWEFVRRSDGPDRIEVWFEADMNDAACNEIVELLQNAAAVLREEPIGSMPIVSHRKQLPKPRVPRPPSEVIRKLNKFCDEVSELGQLLPELEELTIQSAISTVLLPKEIESLELHLATLGWDELSPKARDLVKNVLDRTRQRRETGT